jgi:hypothetical protein
MAQLVAHHTGSVGVRGSNPLSSTNRKPALASVRVGFRICGRARAATVENRDTAHLRWLADHLRADLLDAVIINTGPNAYRRPDGIGVVPLALLGP